MFAVFSFHIHQRFHDALRMPVCNADHPVFPGLAFNHGEQDIVFIGFGTDNEIAFPMAKLFPTIDGGRTLLDASSEDTFVLPKRRLFRRTPKFIRKINVLDVEKPQVNIGIQCLSADHLLSVKITISQNAADTGIDGPFVFSEMSLHIGNEGGFFQKVIMSAA